MMTSVRLESPKGRARTAIVQEVIFFLSTQSFKLVTEAKISQEKAWVWTRVLLTLPSPVRIEKPAAAA